MSRLWPFAWLIPFGVCAYMLYSVLCSGGEVVGSDWLLGSLFAGNLLAYGFATWVLFRRRRRIQTPGDLLHTFNLSVLASLFKTPRSTSADLGTTLYVESVELQNIRCFDRLEIPLQGENRGNLTTLVLGDNSTGKSTLLRSIALGLCPESDATALMKSMSGPFLRTGERRGSILIRLRGAKFEGWIHTRIERSSGGNEIVRQETEPGEFPWDRIFLAGYGTERTAQATASPEKYSSRAAVNTLFGDGGRLLNPEAVLSRQPEEVQSRIREALATILMMEGKDAVRKSDKGLMLAGAWGEEPMYATSDGYRNTVQWVVDFLGWQSFAEKFTPTGPGGGVLLIDEIEQHLHPRWQRHFIQLLRSEFPAVQLIATTHTPLIASGTADVDGAEIHRLYRDEDLHVRSQAIPSEQLRGMRADQVLAGAFGLLTTRNPKNDEDIERYTTLLDRDRTGEEEEEFRELDRRLKGVWEAQNPYEHAVEKALSEVLEKMADANSDRMEVEKKRQLRKLFERGGPQ